jgi:hypothetical protein
MKKELRLRSRVAESHENDAQSWWYEGQSGVDIYVRQKIHDGSYVTLSCTISRRALESYLSKF